LGRASGVAPNGSPLRLLQRFLNGVIDCHAKHVLKLAWAQVMYSDTDAVLPASTSAQ
jgi:hypothetical protein